jgi:hypothetical protein
MRPIHEAPTLALLLCAVGLSGCGSDAAFDPTSASTVPASGPQLKSTGTQQQITGVAFITLVEAGNAAERFTFSAVRHRDGDVSGQFELFTEQDGGIRLHGTITCLGILDLDGELVGHLGGTVTRSSVPDLLGTNVIWTVVDEGEGGTAFPDLASDLFGFTPPDVVEDFCAFAFGLPVNESHRGNIQVHP